MCGVQRQASEGTLQAELHAALSWARWMVWFHFAQRRVESGKVEQLALREEARPPPDSSSGVLPTAPCLLGQLSGICSILARGLVNGLTKWPLGCLEARL